MIKISMRELSRHLAEYVEKAQKGERIIVTKRNTPLIQISYFNENVKLPSWKTDFKPIKIKGEPASKTIIKMRKES